MNTSIGAVPVDSGQLLILDPCNLSPAATAELEETLAKGYAVLVTTPSGDGWHPITINPDANTLTIHDAYDPQPPEREFYTWHRHDGGT